MALRLTSPRPYAERQDAPQRGGWLGKVRETKIFPDGTFDDARGQALLAVAVFLGAIAVLLTLAQISYDPLDPSVNTATARRNPENWLGHLGAIWSDLGFQIFGYALWLVPLYLLCWALIIVVQDRIGFLLARLFALPFVLALLSTVLTVPGWMTGWTKPAFAGGAIGDLILGNANHWLRLPEWLTATLCLFFLPVLLGWLFAQTFAFWRLVGHSIYTGLSRFFGQFMGLAALFSGAAKNAPSPPNNSFEAPSSDSRLPVFVQRDDTSTNGAPQPDGTGDLANNNFDDDAIMQPVTPNRFEPLHDLPPFDVTDEDDNEAPAQFDDGLTVPLVAYEANDGFAADDFTNDYDDEDDAEYEDDTPPWPAAEVTEAPPQKELFTTQSLRPSPADPPKRAAPPKRKARAAAAAGLGYNAPSIDFLQSPDPSEVGSSLTKEQMKENAELLTEVLRDFGVKGEITNVRPGPVVTLYELKPAPGTKTSRVVNLADDIARSMSALSARIATVPGRNVIGIELPNPGRETVYLREMLETDAYRRQSAKLPLALGKDIGGTPVYVDLSKMPHLLVAGTTGSGKSVAVNTMILSLLYCMPPERCKFIMIDPKMLELSVYDGIPHLLSPVVTEPKKAVVALNWAVREMEERYRAMSNLSVRNIDGYNKRLEQARKNGEILTRKVQTGFDIETGSPEYEEQEIDLTPLPFIVIIVDEMADLMLVAGKEIEGAVQRLAQMARAAGIHLVMATQRPSVDVITGTIKANFPTRISFHVTSKIDSRTILGEMGAEQLLGQGDMLYMPNGGRILRVHGPFASDDEVEEIVRHLRDTGEPAYIDEISEEPAEGFGDAGDAAGSGTSSSGDDLYDQAVAIVLRDKKASTSYVQRHLQIGYNRAARLIERMEAEGLISSADRVGRREILAGNPNP